MQSRSHSLSFSAFPVALIAFVCVVMGLLSGGSPTPLAGTDWPTGQTRVERIEAPNSTAVPMLSSDIRFADDIHEEVAELADPMDDEADEDETKHYALRSDLATFRSPIPTGRNEAAADRAALTPFRLLAFSTRGSPSA
ncbi:MAG: hypothetical protein JNK87_11340 [Bryobacterales bacterium]|nr:hypothetical protein [Bryobacterales bacterium]